MEVRNIRIDDFDYPLPEERIALHPLEKRDSCKLLVSTGAGKVRHALFSDLPLFLKPDTLIIANETKVIRARMEFLKETGARIEIFLLEPESPHDYVLSFASTEECSWQCLIGNRKRWKDGVLTKRIEIDGREVTLTARLLEGEKQAVSFSWDDPSVTFAGILESAGNIPIPPYLKRESEESDTRDYQTVYSRTQGSVAAPTAGLHFTPELIDELKRGGNEFATVTLHVGAGTFQPVKSEEIGDHPMHSEWISVSRHTLGRIISALENGRDILAVGTTSVRTLESLPYIGAALVKNDISPVERMGRENLPNVTQWMPYGEKFKEFDTLRALKALREFLLDNRLDALETNTSIMIAPGFRWRIVNRLITNFHQPKSTLLLLVASFLEPLASLGLETATMKPSGAHWRKLYDEALANGYRFLSYGDACLFSRGPQAVELPASKSMAIRAATIQAVEDGSVNVSMFRRLSVGDDVELYVKALQAVTDSARELETLTEVYIGEGAAPLRFLTAFAASLPGSNVAVECANTLKRRPLQPLIEALHSMGADIDFDSDPDHWHLEICGKKLSGGPVIIDSSFTSQYVSALMLASPLWSGPLEIDSCNGAVSRPYIEMTRRMMEGYGNIEPDWSAASFFFEWCMVSGGKVAIASLPPSPGTSLQGDAVAEDLFRSFGVVKTLAAGPERMAFLRYEPVEVEDADMDLSSMPDLVPPLAVALCYRRIPFKFRGVAHLRFKESDRLLALSTILVRLGYGVSVEDEALVFDGSFKPMEDFPVSIVPYGDHRIAMALYPLELKGLVFVEDKSVVSKSFPNFYQQF